ncbi:UDP-3-O-(3-hydroxymyristoyl)glucosamine N-acyltransferase [Vogesella oryzae]|uniref:UDP-3-O-(3-hydroxymyristoyl)glucosamine N-acyltransferase n=1 Tax=Vogesella oryzae TaxID=1735285 RepID=UPI001583C196|nr:UDP-3-O-(3-hydroxymyristoyl)glucosamine N-acyltransferase [Vogesella oryzae]
MKLSQIVAVLGGELRGEDREISRLAPMGEAAAQEITFLANPKFRSQLASCQAGAIIVKPALADEAQKEDRSLILIADPYLYFAKVATLFNPPAKARAGVHASAVIGDGARIAASAEVRELVSVGRNVVIGERCILHPGVVLGDDVELGDDVVLYPNVTVYHGCRLGNRVGVHSGTVIGADGFGLAWAGDSWYKIPQTGRVIIEDDVEIGANTTIDRGALTDTIIRKDAKIDNLVQVAHNVEIGAHTAIAGCAGIAGSTKIGANCTIGGAAMMVGHIEIADHTHIGGGTLVSKSIRNADNYASSFPLSTYKDWLTNASHLRHLDQLVTRVKQLEKALKEVQQNKDVQA